METTSFLLIVSILHLYLPLSEGVDEVIVRVCPSRKADWDAAARRKECSTKGGNYHCVRNQDGKLVESCVPKVWIDAGDCPILYESNGKFGYDKCPKNYTCPFSRYLSDTVYQYPVCFEKPQEKTTIAVLSTVTYAVSTQAPDSVSLNATQKEETINQIPAVAISVGVFFGFSPLIILLVFWLRRQHKEPDDKCKGVEEGECLLPAAVEISCPGIPKIGKSSTIKCSLSNMTPTQIRWKRNNVDIAVDVKSKYKGGTPTEPSLTILNISEEDLCNYQCVCFTEDNKEGIKSNTFKLQIQAVKISGPKKAMTIGESCTIKCKLIKLTATEMQWRKNNVFIDTSDENKYTGGTPSMPSLTVLNISALDHGDYQCICKESIQDIIESNIIKIDVPGRNYQQ